MQTKDFIFLLSKIETKIEVTFEGKDWDPATLQVLSLSIQEYLDGIFQYATEDRNVPGWFIDEIKGYRDRAIELGFAAAEESVSDAHTG